MIIQIQINEKEYNLFKQYCTLMEEQHTPEKDLKEYITARANEMEKYLQKTIKGEKR